MFITYSSTFQHLRGDRENKGFTHYLFLLLVISHRVVLNGPGHVHEKIDVVMLNDPRGEHFELLVQAIGSTPILPLGGVMM